MLAKHISGPWGWALLVSAGLALCAGTSRAGENDADLLKIIQQQQQELNELQRRIDERAHAVAAPADAAPQGPGRVVIDDRAVKTIVADYLRENPGAGMPPGVQTGYSTATGFAIRSPNDPSYTNWDDESKIPFELRIRGRIQAAYQFYKVTDNVDHQRQRLVYPTGGTNEFSAASPTANANPTGLPNADSSGDFSQLEIKRMRLIFEGTVFDPDLRYHIQFDGTTRGIPALTGGSGLTGLAGNGRGGIGGDGNTAATVDHAVRLISCFMAYDWHPCCSSKGCGEDCCDGAYKYSPTVSAILGKLKPFFSFEEVMGNANQQFVEFGMAEWFFDTDDDTQIMYAGMQIKALEDRFFFQTGFTDDSNILTANLQGNRLPGFNAGWWYDFGGTWNEARHRWDLYGDCISDIDYSCHPVVRVGSAVNANWYDRRSMYSNALENLVRVSNVGADGANATFVTILNGPVTVNGAGTAMDKFDQYKLEAFVAGKWRGFSFLLDGWGRECDNFAGQRNANGVDNPILYTANLPGFAAAGAPPLKINGVTLANPGSFTAVFPVSGMFDYGWNLQCGYFIVPKRIEIAARWDQIRGQSGTLLGDGTVRPGPVIAGTQTWIVNGAFRTYHESDEYAVGFNYYFRRQQVKWQTDLSFYDGGNPAVGGQSPAGFLPGTDGWMVRTQIQLAF
jgi:hypothetical protein